MTTMTRTNTLKTLLFAPALPLALLLIPLTAAGVARAAEPASVDLTFQVGERKGAVMVGLYDSEAAYGGGKPVHTAMVPVAAGPVTARFPRVKPGRYAAKAFHDVDGDGEMDMNLMGIPTEPFAFSNNAPARGGPAKWSAAAFEVGPQGAAQTLVIR
jgi:uncharacterized protein (DUF2141 family)